MSDDIPVGSPPAPLGRHAAPGGWYADPVDQAQERYWDGWQWTRNVRPRSGGAPRRHSRQAAAPKPAAGSNPEPAVGSNGHSGHSPDPRSGPTPYLPVDQSGHQAPVQPGIGQPTYRMVPATADGVPLAGWWWRALAYLIDFFLVYAVVEIISRIIGWSAAINRATNAYVAYLTEVFTTGAELDFRRALELASPVESTYVNLTTMVLFVVYSALMLRARGATLGKLVCRLRVVPVDQGRSAPGLAPATAWVRPLATKLFEVFPPVQLVDLLFPLWDRRRQTLHDKVARTQVIREERRPR